MPGPFGRYNPSDPSVFESGWSRVADEIEEAFETVEELWVARSMFSSRVRRLT